MVAMKFFSSFAIAIAGAVSVNTHSSKGNSNIIDLDLQKSQHNVDSTAYRYSKNSKLKRQE
jgi:hypothetical protein